VEFAWLTVLEGNVGWSPIYTVRSAIIDTDGDRLDDAWERTHFGNLSRDGATDSDWDGQSDYDEFVAATNPCATPDFFHILDWSLSNQTATVSWSSVPGKNYQLETCLNLGAPVWRAVADGSRVADGWTTTWTGALTPQAQYVRVQVVRP
jgi:hypothetical protein